MERWHPLCRGSLLSQRFARNEALDAAEPARVNEQVEVWRARLMDISWLMRMLNASIAREQFGKRWTHGIRDCERYLPQPRLEQ